MLKHNTKTTSRVIGLLLLFLGFSFFSLQAQSKKKKAVKAKTASVTTSSPTLADARLKGFDQRKQLIENSLVKNIAFKEVGPYVMSGRVVDLEVNEADPSIFYAAFASGGLWKTKSNGTEFTPLFDKEASMTIGDIAVDWKNGETIWVGTGENNSSRSSYSGTGIYKSDDQGKTWQWMGLGESHHISRIIIHPENPNVLWVAILGHLYSKNEERGLYKTTDGGKTWNKTLYVDDNSGIVDLVIDPNNPDVLYAASWERIRYAWDFVGNGKGSGMYKSTDGGETWEKLTQEGSGFPTTEGVGRIGLAVAPSNSQIVYAFLDNQDRREKKEEAKKEQKVTKDFLRSVSQADFLALKDEEINEYLNQYRFPRQYNSVDIKKQVESGIITPISLVEYVENANANLFDTEVKGAEFYRSEDGGKSWQKMHEGYVESLVFSYGYYFGQIRVDAQNPNHIYALGVPVIKSKDGGKTWESISDRNVHSDHHALWVNPKRSGHLVLGNDGGINISYNDGESWIKANNLPVGQFYAVAIDMAEPYNIYGGLQDNGVWYGAHTYEHSTNWESEGSYPYQRIMGGDGMQVQVDWRDNETAYTGFQFGNYYRLNTKTGDRKRITPSHQLGERPLRWNWQSPILLSRHNQDVLYMGSNRFHRSLNQGDDFETLSGDLTRGGKKGNVPYGTLAAIDESPLKFGLLYVGSDDGLVHVSKDAGYTWTKVYDSRDQHWVSRVEASNHQEGRVYMSLNGYRWDNFEAMVFVSEDYGTTWQRIGMDLPAEPVNVVKEDPENENVIYVGTDHGAYISIDRGKTFMAFSNGLPAVPVHDLVIHPRDKHLVLGTHGRSFYVADVAQLQKLEADLLEKELHLFEVSSTTYSSFWGNSFSPWREANTPETTFSIYAKLGGEVSLKVKSAKGLVLKSFKKDLNSGLNFMAYDFSFDENMKGKLEAELKQKEDKVELKKAKDGNFYLQAGTYEVEVTKAGTTASQKLMVKAPRKRPARKPMKKTP